MFHLPYIQTLFHAGSSSSNASRNRPEPNLESCDLGSQDSGFSRSRVFRNEDQLDADANSEQDCKLAITLAVDEDEWKPDASSEQDCKLALLHSQTNQRSH